MLGLVLTWLRVNRDAGRPGSGVDLAQVIEKLNAERQQAAQRFESQRQQASVVATTDDLSAKEIVAQLRTGLADARLQEKAADLIETLCRIVQSDLDEDQPGR